MAGHIQIWVEELERLLEERSGAQWTVTHEVTEPRPAPLFVSTIAITGAEPGELSIAMPGAELVQLVQLATQQASDPQAPLDEALLGAWKSFLEATLPPFVARLQSEGTGEYQAQVRSLRAVESEEVDAAGAAEQEPAQAYTLRTGEIALSMRLHVVSLAPAQPEAAVEVPAEADFPASAATAAQEPSQDPAQAQAEAEAVRRAHQAEADRLAAEEMERAATEAEERAAWRRNDATVEESSPFRTHPERLNLLLDIELEATLRFGALEMPLRKVLELGPGDVLQLDRHVQEPVDLVVGDRIVARGEVVLVGGNFGLHVTEVAEPRRRLDSIRALF